MSVTSWQWKRTGACRIVPWYFGLMRAEFEERRETEDMFQIRWVSAGRFPAEFDNAGPFGFLSTVATPAGDTPTYGARALWRYFVRYYKAAGDR